MEDTYPIVLNVKGLFEESDPKSAFLIDKLNAWLNFKTLSANWFADESNIPKINIVVLPEPIFNEHEVDTNNHWQIKQTSKAFFLHNTLAETKTAEIILKLPIETIKQAMDRPQTLEPVLQTILTDVINHCANDFNLNLI